MAAFINEGTIAPDVPGGNLVFTGTGWTNQGSIQVAAFETVTFDGSWSNSGKITIDNGTLNVGGSTTTAGLGIFAPAPAANFSRTGGGVYLSATVSITRPGNTLALDDRTGPWYLDAGTIEGGTITTADGDNLVATNSNGGGVLDSVTLDGTLDLASGFAPRVNVTGGMTLNGLVLLGSADGSDFGTLLSSSTQTISGTGSILFGGSPSNSLSVPRGGTILTVAAGLTVHGQNGTIGSREPLSMAGVRCVANQATIAADGGGTLDLEQLTLNLGSLIANAGSSLILENSLAIDSAGALASQSTGTISVLGNLVGTSVDVKLFTPSGTTAFDGFGTAAAPQLLEAMSQDLGDIARGYTKNFAYGALVLGDNNYVRLVDNEHNSAGTGAEAIYASSLTVPASSTLELNGLHIYVYSAQIHGNDVNGSVSLVPVDSTPPFSTVTALPTFSPGSFAVSWSGQDDPGGSGIAAFDVEVSDNGGVFTLWQSHTTATSATFTGVDGHAYGFYSVAVDYAGNVQATPAGPQTKTQVDTTGPISSTHALPANEPTATFAVSWSGTDNGGSGIATFDVFVADNGGPCPSLFQATATTATSATFTGLVRPRLRLLQCRN